LLLKSSICPFCEIISGKDDSPVIFENSISFAFLDHRPLFAGHSLVIPKQHVQTISELSEAITGDFFKTVRFLTGVIESAMESQGTFIGMNNRVSQSVPHFHVHIVPRNKGDGLRGFFWPRKKYGSVEEMTQIRDIIRKRINLILQTKEIR